MLELANNGYITATDLADYIVKNHSKSFREAYQKTAAIINMAEKRKKIHHGRIYAPHISCACSIYA